MKKLDFSGIEKKCLNCNDTLILKVRRDIERKNFCSRSCSCTYYGKINLGNPENLANFLKNSCTPEANSKKGVKGKMHYLWKDKELAGCLKCGNQFERILSDKRKYCSFKCSLDHIHEMSVGKYRVEKKNHSCINCGNNFQRSVNYKQNPKYCSLRCNGIYQTANSKKKMTDIEIILENVLISAGIDYITQVNIKNISVADFVIGEILVFADGDYWHSLPGRAEKDLLQTEKLTLLGYTVLRFNGSDILNNIENVRKKIFEYV